VSVVRGRSNCSQRSTTHVFFDTCLLCTVVSLQYCQSASTTYLTDSSVGPRRVWGPLTVYRTVPYPPTAHFGCFRYISVCFQFSRRTRGNNRLWVSGNVQFSVHWIIVLYQIEYSTSFFVSLFHGHSSFRRPLRGADRFPIGNFCVPPEKNFPASVLFWETVALQRTLVSLIWLSEYSDKSLTLLWTQSEYSLTIVWMSEYSDSLAIRLKKPRSSGWYRTLVPFVQRFKFCRGQNFWFTQKNVLL